GFLHGFRIHFDFVDPNGNASTAGSRAVANPSREEFEIEDIGLGLDEGDLFSGRLTTQLLCLEFTPPDTSLTASFWLWDFTGLRSNELTIEIKESDFFN
ncbi:MAG: hypothetical protein AAF629_23170, partial [Chloroflexota bacterium]